MNKVNKTQFKRGFTLVELLMSLAIFTVITTLFISTTLVLMDLNRKAENTRTTLDVLDFVMTSMVKKIRYSHTYGYSNAGGQACMTPDRVINTDTDGLSVSFGSMFSPVPGVRYWLSNSGAIMRSVGANNYTLTPSEIYVEKLCYYLSGKDRGVGDGQPLVTIFVKGYTGNNVRGRAPFSLQTSVSQRSPDLTF